MEIENKENVALEQQKFITADDFFNASKQLEELVFNPQVEIRIPKGIANIQLQENLPQLFDLLKSKNNNLQIRNWKSFTLSEQDDSLRGLVSSIVIGCLRTSDGSALSHRLHHFNFSSDCIHLFKLNEDGPLAQDISADSGSDDTTIGSQLWQLPCVEFDHIWENLIYESNIKNEIMSYVYSLINLSDKGANMKIINVNRLILLLGPPGTGKTSLCKGIAQHLAIRLNKRYPRSLLIEINSHSLFSKWFSESGKLVLNMFNQIDELAEDRKNMVFVLIDEVESLGMSRESSSSRGDPADSIRAVNALITQIDRIRRRENVLVLCTSNLDKCLDRALVDRADIIKHVGQPSIQALYSILLDCIHEMKRVGIINDEVNILPVSRLNEETHNNQTKRLMDISLLALGLSGRSIRQIPALAYSKAHKESITTCECLSLFFLSVKEKKNGGEE